MRVCWVFYRDKQTRYVDGMPTSEVTRSLSRTSTHPTLVIIMVLNGWLTSFSFHVNRPSYSWDTAISDSDLETPRSRSWVWSKGKVIQSAQYPITRTPDLRIFSAAEKMQMGVFGQECGEISAFLYGKKCGKKKVNIGSGNGLVPSGNKPLPEPILTQIVVGTWSH